MTDLQTEVRRSLDATMPPDLEEDIRRRVQVPRPDQLSIPDRIGGSRDGARRAVAGVAAMAIFVTAGVLVWSAFRGGHTTQIGDASTPSAGATSDVLTVQCDGSSTLLSAPAVAAAPDGVHLSLQGSSENALVDIVSSGDEPIVAQGIGGDSVWALAPGEHHVWCVPLGGLNFQDAIRDGLGAAFTVTDSNGAFASTALACPAGEQQRVERQTGEGIGDQSGLPFDALASWVRTSFDGIQATDDVRPAGYTEATLPSPVWMVVDRDGATIAWFFILDRERDAITLDGRVCAGSGIS
jgi:hypothetical protein